MRLPWCGIVAPLLAVAGYATVCAQESPRPNIVFILADDLGYGDLGCYGQEKIRTPRLDAMAAEGMRFTQAYSGSTVCAPSRCSLMTGRHSGTSRIRGNASVPLLPGDVCVAEALKGAGYRTALVGKWGLGDAGTTGEPTAQGFDSYFGYLDQVHAHTYYPATLWRNGVEEAVPGNVESQRNVATERVTYSHDLFTTEAAQFVRANSEAPFFLYLAYTIPHANNERHAALGDGMEVPDYGDYAKEDWPASQKGHAAMISRLDRDVGALLDLLRELGIDKNTLVIFSSDNGTHKEGGADPAFFKSSGPLRGIKRDLYEGGIRVPAIAWWPGTVAGGAVSAQPWAFWDFLPTAAELAGTSAPPEIDGISIAPTLLGRGEQRQHEYFYWEFHEGDFLQAVRQGPWKAIRSRKSGDVELFNLDKDIGETTNVAAENPAVMKSLAHILDTARTPSEHWPG